jgi:hypothetical protein
MVNWKVIARGIGLLLIGLLLVVSLACEGLKEADTKEAKKCSLDSDCPQGYICLEGTCKFASKCEEDKDCQEGFVCHDGKCISCEGMETTFYVDEDADGYGSSVTKTVCAISKYEMPPGVAVESGDCDDSKPNVNPSAPEVCDGLDNNCDNEVDEGCECQNGQIQTCYTGSPRTKGLAECKAGTQTCSNGRWGECEGEITPQSEVCYSKDNDCDGQTDEGDVCIGYFTNVSQMSLGFHHTCALKTDNSLWCWGGNSSGQLGYGDAISRTAPIQITKDIASVSLGCYHTCAVKTDNTLWCWGSSGFGQLGTTETVVLPIQITTDVTSVSLGCYHTCAVKTDNTLWCWGYNASGQLGDGTTEDKTLPIQITKDIASVSLGCAHTCTVKTDNTLWCWGDNSYGQLGDGTTEGRTSPVQVTAGVISVSSGDRHTCAVETDGSLWCWGYNEYGQVGDGTNINKTEPVHVAPGR